MIGRTPRPTRSLDAAATVDEAVQTLRRDAGPLLAWWLLAWAPQVATAWWLIDAVAARDEPVLSGRVAAFTLAMPWRWAVTGWMQARMLRRRGVPVHGGRAGVAATLEVVRVRVLAAAAGLLGAVLLLPGLWMLYVSAFAGPRLLAARQDEDAPPPLGLLGGAAPAVAATRALARHALLVSLLTLTGTLVAVASFFALLYLLQAWLNVELATQAQSWSQAVLLLTAALGAWMLGDLILALSAVPLLDRLEARAGGGDLRRRLDAAEAAAAAEPVGRAA